MACLITKAEGHCMHRRRRSYFENMIEREAKWKAFRKRRLTSIFRVSSSEVTEDTVKAFLRHHCVKKKTRGTVWLLTASIQL